MKTYKLGLTVAMLGAAATLSTPALADGYYKGSIKDAPVAASPGHCYIRGDVGYSWSRDPEIKWTVTDAGTGTFLTDAVTGVQMDNTWLIEGGFGCGSGVRGLRGEIMLGYHGKRDVDGTPGPWFGVPPEADPLHTSIRSTTLMFNAYYDLGKMSGFVPYVGAGVGVSRNQMDGVYFTGNPALINTIEGKDTYSLAWSLMAGVGYQVSDRITLDLGYRYLDMGSARSGTIDSAGFTNPVVRIDDISAHELKIGLRFALGGR